MESAFRIAFWSVFGGMVVIQAIFTLRIRLAEERMAVVRKPIECEAVAHAVIRAVRSISLAAFLVVYAVKPPWLEVLTVPFPDWLRWIGVALGLASLAFYAWSRATLGQEWSSPLQLHENHHLVTTGPYAWMRHPIYSSLMLFMAGIALIAANWFLVAFLVVSIVDLALRMPKEEQMMLDEFGDEYEAYMQRTGRLLPW